MSKYAGHKYTWSKPFGSVHHHWELRSANGGVHFHVGIVEGYGPSCGLEFHSVKPLHGESAPDHIDCPVTGGRCWHDGTSLYAQDILWPIIESYLRTGDHGKIFEILEREDAKYFARYAPSPSPTAAERE